MRRTLFVLATSVAVLAACSERTVYDGSIFRTAVFEESHVRPLKPLTYPVQAATLTNNTAWADGKVGQTVPIASKYGVWISVEPELQEICRTYPRDRVVEKLHQLLGLKPATEADRNARFIRFTIEPQKTGPTGQGVFRPCANPDPAADRCGNSIGSNVPSSYVTWFANNLVYSYQVNEEMGRTGYPWTRLGYTYNWDPQAPDFRGVQEYVVPENTKVTITGIVSPEEYCAPK